MGIILNFTKKINKMSTKKIIEKIINEVDVYGLDHKFCEVHVGEYIADCTVRYKGFSCRKIELIHFDLHYLKNGICVQYAENDYFAENILDELTERIQKLNDIEELEYANYC